MSDIFREVDEDIRHERFKRLWDRFGPWVIGVAVLIVLITAGYRGWMPRANLWGASAAPAAPAPAAASA